VFFPSILGTLQVHMDMQGSQLCNDFLFLKITLKGKYTIQSTNMQILIVQSKYIKYKLFGKHSQPPHSHIW